ncbi:MULTISPECIES: 4-(cytidine 5'-diphospho)-2-C-methyl-D-erythritol kinase [Acidobacteriaceae]|uniref:4-(cytidine 5'-diphospho)-2-C-methyl-D-erythritol kinase n=1 Tax=Acidobacteriaceae TaxID=204434 RepID=UPI00131DACE2|nr:MULTISPECIES: 4-(cytidine 5'-diphospho)-2-C-methyl-D-erythritol kinase [Acidobacteriaceae]MDW5267453.1 4-(cytidine 5'-diphospho)-2-C-methyl-D-erythritol kinase [Edaphobacter sp.]
MATRVRSYSKINLGLAIGPARADGFHGLTTLYQTLDLHDVVTVTAQRAVSTRLALTSNHARVPLDGRNTAWKIVEQCLERLGITAEVEISIEKNLPIQGGMGAGSANAAAALIALERELNLALPGATRLKLAAAVGSDVPLFLLGGAVLGLGRGEQVVPLPDLPRTACLIAVPNVGVSTPQAFRDWDALAAGKTLTASVEHDRLMELSLAYASLYAEPGTSGIVRNLNPEKKQGSSDDVQRGVPNGLAENTLLSLVRTGVENDFEQVVFPAYPSLRETKRLLTGTDSEAPALYAALSGSGSALFGLYRSDAGARAAQQRIQSAATQAGVRTFLTETLPRAAYWERMFAG